MNFYKRHIGDYIKATAHLSLLEHGIYTRLLDVYYTRESGIPDEQAARLISARTKDEREALQSVLNEFFTLTDGVWTQTRCDEEITIASIKAERNREVGKRGGRPKQTGLESKPKNNPDGLFPEPKNNPIQTPDSSNQTPVTRLEELLAHASSQDPARACEGNERKHPGPGPGPEPPKITPEATLAIPLRQAGVKVTSMDPVLCGWVTSGFTPERCMQAVAIARRSKADNESIGARYLDAILRDPKNWTEPHVRVNGNGTRTPRKTAEETEIEYIERFIREGMSDAQIVAHDDLACAPDLPARVRAIRQELLHEHH